MTKISFAKDLNKKSLIFISILCLFMLSKGAVAVDLCSSSTDCSECGTGSCAGYLSCGIYDNGPDGIPITPDDINACHDGTWSTEQCNTWYVVCIQGGLCGGCSQTGSCTSLGACVSCSGDSGCPASDSDGGDSPASPGVCNSNVCRPSVTGSSRYTENVGQWVGWNCMAANSYPDYCGDGTNLVEFYPNSNACNAKNYDCDTYCKSTNPSNTGTCSGDRCVCQACVPKTCTDLGLCGTNLNDGCGGTIPTCSCQSGQNCVSGVCKKCMTCANFSNDGALPACGVHDDECGGTINCGTCKAPNQCASDCAGYTYAWCGGIGGFCVCANDLGVPQPTNVPCGTCTFNKAIGIKIYNNVLCGCNPTLSGECGLDSCNYPHNCPDGDPCNSGVCACTDRCSYAGQITCTGTKIQECRTNWDSDHCLELGTISDCASMGPGYTCNGGACVESVPPVTTIQCNGRSCLSNCAYNKDISVSFSCIDESSGCGNTFYCSSDSSSCNPSGIYGSPFYLSDGINYVKYFSKDLAGNSESIKYQTIEINKNNANIVEALLSIESLGAGAQNVDLTYQITPNTPSISVSFNDNPIVPPKDSTKMTVSVTSGTPSGVYSIKVIGTAGTLVREAVYTLTLGQSLSSMSVNMGLNPNIKEIAQGQSASTEVSLNLIGGSPSALSFDTILDKPCNGCTLTFNETSCTPNCVSNLTIETAMNTAPGIYGITVNASNSELSTLGVFYLLVKKAFDFNMTLSVNESSVLRGQSATTMLIIKLKNASMMSEPVSLSTGLAEPSISVTFNPTTGNPDYNSLVTISTQSTTPNGDYLITLNGSASEVSHTTDYLLHVTSPVCTKRNPVISIVPTSKIGTQGSAQTYSINVKNDDVAACPSSAFDLTSTCPPGWTCTLSKVQTTSLSPGQSDSATITMTSPSTATANTYSSDVTATSISDALLKGSVSAVYVINSNICSGTSALKCTVPGLEHANDERILSNGCARFDAKIDCNNVANSHFICISDLCARAEPAISSYSLSTNDIKVGETFTISVNGNCPSNLPGKCLIECRVIHPDGHYIELDNWDDTGAASMPSVMCDQTGDYTVDYCKVATDFNINSGWGAMDSTDRIVTCTPNCAATLTQPTVTGTDPCTVSSTTITAAQCDGQIYYVKEGSNTICTGSINSDTYTTNCVLGSASAGGHEYDLWIGSSKKATWPITCSAAPTPTPTSTPTPDECNVNSDCNDNNPCTQDDCNSSGGYKHCTHTAYGDGYIPSDGSCGTYSNSCPDKCDLISDSYYGEFRGGTRTCDNYCSAGSCTSTCPVSCQNSDYSSINECSFGCESGTDCTASKWCPEFGGYDDGCSGTITEISQEVGCGGTQECYTGAQCMPTTNGNPSCIFNNVDYDNGCIFEDLTCTATCYSDSDTGSLCKYTHPWMIRVTDDQGTVCAGDTCTRSSSWTSVEHTFYQQGVTITATPDNPNYVACFNGDCGTNTIGTRSIGKNVDGGWVEVNFRQATQTIQLHFASGYVNNGGSFCIQGSYSGQYTCTQNTWTVPSVTFIVPNDYITVTGSSWSTYNGNALIPCFYPAGSRSMMACWTGGTSSWWAIYRGFGAISDLYMELCVSKNKCPTS